MTLVAGLRAASYGIPFQPVAGVHGSELARINHWQTMRDPYGSGKDVYVIPAVHPEIAVIHAAEIDTEGNARVYGSPFWDQISQDNGRGCNIGYVLAAPIPSCLYNQLSGTFSAPGTPAWYGHAWGNANQSFGFGFFTSAGASIQAW